VRAPSLIHAVGFSFWKRHHVRAFLQKSRIVFVSHPDKLPKNQLCNIATWGMKISDSDFPAGSKIIRLEDGFIRSVGLGADLVRPLSWVLDDLGIYYNARNSSRLEVILNAEKFSSDLLERARVLREGVIQAKLTKYNTGSRAWMRPCKHKKIILVPGQVESDASIKYGASEVQTNLGLLKAVRCSNPNDFIIYKPHPDVTAGLRKQGLDENEAGAFCDLEIRDVSMAALLDEVDEVHTMTSLSGFEALLREKRVVTYGMPFYAGWGLTKDQSMLKEVAARRVRRLSIEELVAGALILYPAYISRDTGLISSPENALKELKEWKEKASKSLPFWQITLRWFLKFVRY
jgi:capsular polysaccharide export protein